MKNALRFTVLLGFISLFVLPAVGDEQQSNEQESEQQQNQEQEQEQEAERPRRRFRRPIEVDPVAQVRVDQLGSRGVRVHDPSTIVKCKDEYWIFYTGRGVPSYHSKDLITWQRGPQAITTPPDWLSEVVPPRQGRRGGGFGGGSDDRAPRVPSFWAPDIIHLNNQYLLYFSYSAFGRNTSGIALATNPTLDPDDPEYKWTEQGLVVTSNSDDNYNAIDPAIILDQDGKLWMVFGSFWDGIQLIQLDPKTGKRIAPDSPMHNLADSERIEAPYIYFHNGWYWLFLNWGICCRGENSTYNVRVGRSKEIIGSYLDKDGIDMRQGGGTLLLETDGPFIGPGHPGIIKVDDVYWLGMHFYNGAQGGLSQYALRPLEWGDDGWPIVITPPPIEPEPKSADEQEQAEE